MKSVKHRTSTIFLFLLIGILFSCNKHQDQSIDVFAAAGTMLPVNDICNSFEINQNNNTNRNFAASGALARQINAGAEADIYISANKQWIDFLIQNNLVNKENVSEFAYNKLVLITSVDNDVYIDFTQDFDIETAIKDKISIGNPKYVPVGKYAKQMFDSLNWYNQIRDKIILAKDVTSVLHYVELGECDWGIVYYSEAIKSDKVKIAYEIPQNLYSPITFYIGLLNDCDKNRNLYNYFKGDQSKGILEKYGFTIQ
ncbi:MAG: molybdate ABC transporter substrate-binding protein [Bacteroidales bacterium]|nr:molybdate ABC transporter substrate-binding protein [Bacteroidales bacterium]